MSNSTAPAIESQPGAPESSLASSLGPTSSLQVPPTTLPTLPPSSPPPSLESPAPSPSATSQETSPPSPPPEPTTAAPVTTAVTSVINDTGPPRLTTVTLTSTSETPTSAVIVTPTPSPSTALQETPSSSFSSSTSATPTSANSTNTDDGGGGLTSGARIAVAVVVPVVGVALIVLGLLFLWRRRKQKKDAEELRRKEVEEYGYNPNNDPTAPAAAAVSSQGDEPYDMREDEGSGYRGWGTGTTTLGSRKLSTTLSGGTGPVGLALSDGGGQSTGHAMSGSAGSPTHPPTSDVPSGDPLLTDSTHPLTPDGETIGELGGAPVAGTRRDIHRGPSNASSSYSAANRSDASGEGSLPGAGHPGNYYNGDGAYYDDGHYNHHGQLVDGSYGSQPIIRDVQARRNTRIENPSIVPPQGNAGIAQNF